MEFQTVCGGPWDFWLYQHLKYAFTIRIRIQINHKGVQIFLSDFLLSISDPISAEDSDLL